MFFTIYYVLVCQLFNLVSFPLRCRPLMFATDYTVFALFKNQPILQFFQPLNDIVCCCQVGLQCFCSEHLTLCLFYSFRTPFHRKASLSPNEKRALNVGSRLEFISHGEVRFAVFHPSCRFCL